MADDDGEVVDVPLLQVVVAEVVVVATLVVDDLYAVVRDDVLKDLVRTVVVHVDVVFLGDELFVVALSDADLDVSDLVDVIVVYLYVAVNLLVVELYLFVVESLVVLVGTLYLVDELSLFVVDH